MEATQPGAAVHLRAYPLDPEGEERAYAAVRAFGGSAERDRSRGVGERGEGDADDAAAAEAEHADGDLDGGAQAPPARILLPERARIRSEGACYLGHGAFLRPAAGPEREVVHHLRLLVVNRQAVAVRLPLDRVTLEVGRETAGGEGARAAAVGLTRLAATNARGERAAALTVEPGEDAVAHVFFSSRRLPPALVARWVVEPAGGPAAPGGGGFRWDPARGGGAAEVGGATGPGPWSFSVLLVRRYLIADGPLSELEGRVALGEPLPAERPAGWTEPRVASVGGGSR